MRFGKKKKKNSNSNYDGNYGESTWEFGGCCEDLLKNLANIVIQRRVLDGASASVFLRLNFAEKNEGKIWFLLVRFLRFRCGTDDYAGAPRRGCLLGIVCCNGRWCKEGGGLTDRRISKVFALINFRLKAFMWLSLTSYFVLRNFLMRLSHIGAIHYRLAWVWCNSLQVSMDSPLRDVSC